MNWKRAVIGLLVVLGWAGGLSVAWKRWGRRAPPPPPAATWTGTFHEITAQGTREIRVWQTGKKFRVEQPGISGRPLTEIWMGESGWRWRGTTSAAREIQRAPRQSWVSWQARAEGTPRLGEQAVVGGLTSQVATFHIARGNQAPPWSVTEWVSVDPPGVVTRRDVQGKDQSWRWEAQSVQNVASLHPTLFAPPADRDVQAGAPTRFEPKSVEGHPLADGVLKRFERDRRVSLTDLKGSHVLVLQFFSTRCHACEEAWPVLRTVEAEYRKKGVKFYSVAVEEWGDTEADVRRFMDQELFPWPVLWDDEDAVYERYAPGAPSTVIVDRKGRVTAWRTGTALEEWYRLKLDEAIAAGS